MLVYKSNEIQVDNLVQWPPLKELAFVKVLTGDPVHRGRHDFGVFGSSIQVGVWECSPGEFEYKYPGNEICTIVEGVIEVTDSSGRSRLFNAGDSFFTVKGEVVTWKIKETVRKVFCIYDPA